MSQWKRIGFCRHGIFKPRRDYISVYRKWDIEGLGLAFKYHIITTCAGWDYFGGEPVIVEYLEDSGTIQLRIRSDQKVIERQIQIFKEMSIEEYIRRFGLDSYRRIKIPLDQE